MGRLDGKVALVTGGTRGIGLAIVRAFLAEGARVIYSGTSDRSVTQAGSTLPADGSCAGMVADLEAPDAPARLVGAASARFGRIDVLVNNAGVVSRSSEWDLTPDEWDRLHSVNLRAVFFASQAAAHRMREKPGCSILNVSSIAGQNGGLAGSPAYASAKAGVIGLTRSLARRFAPHGIRVNCIAPADIETDMTAGWPQELRDRLLAITPQNRFGMPEEVAGAAVYFASDESGFVTGQTLSVNGGAYMG